MSNIILIAALTIHIFLAADGAPSVYPGYATKQDVQDWRDARKRDLRIVILDKHVSYCRATGELARAYNEQVNELLAEYRALHGHPISLPDCNSVRTNG